MAFLRSMIALFLLTGAGAAAASTTSFHYAGTLDDAAVPDPSGTYDFRVRLFDGPDAGAGQVGGDVFVPAVPVLAGYFSIELDFGAAVLTPSAWLEFAVKASADANYETLSPRQQVGHVPLALYAESTDWSGVANVPSAVKALAAAPAPAIGKLVIAPALPGAPAGGLVVHRVAFTTTRTVSGGTPAKASFDGFEAWVEPSLALPSLMTAMTALTPSTKVDLFLDEFGSVGGTDYFAELTSSAQLAAMVLEPANAGAPALVHLTFHFGKVEFRIEGGTDYAYDLQAQTGDAVPAVCPGFLSNLEYPFALNGGLVTLAAPNVLDGFVAGTPKFNPPQWSAALDPAHVTTARRLAICSLALATKAQLLTEPVTWVSYQEGATKPDQWTTRMTWASVYVSGFTLSSDYTGAVKTSLQFSPIRFQVESKLATDAPDSAQKSCWNSAAIAPC